MTLWTASVGELLDLRADALVCSANPQLNLSGGVGGEFLLRYGDEMQRYLHGWLTSKRLAYIKPGDVVAAPSCGSHFKTVIHAVAIDAFYETSKESIVTAYSNAFAAAARLECKSIATACLACGYGRADPQLFLSSIGQFAGKPIASIERIEFRSTNGALIDEIRELLESNDVP